MRLLRGRAIVREANGDHDVGARRGGRDRLGDRSTARPREPPTPQPLRGANIGYADVPLPHAEEGE